MGSSGISVLYVNFLSEFEMLRVVSYPRSHSRSVPTVLLMILEDSKAPYTPLLYMAGKQDVKRLRFTQVEGDGED